MIAIQTDEKPLGSLILAECLIIIHKYNLCVSACLLGSQVNTNELIVACTFAFTIIATTVYLNLNYFPMLFFIFAYTFKISQDSIIGKK